MFERELSLVQNYIDALDRESKFASQRDRQNSIYKKFSVENLLERLLDEEEALPTYISDRMPWTANEIADAYLTELNTFITSARDSDAANVFMQMSIAIETIMTVFENESIPFDDEVYGCQDVFTGRYFKSNLDRIRQALAEVNQILQDQGSVSLNAYFSAIGLPMIKIGYNFSWEYPECKELKLDFTNTVSENGMHCILVDFQTYPKQNYEIWS